MKPALPPTRPAADVPLSNPLVGAGLKPALPPTHITADPPTSLPRVDPASAAYVIFTSGSTGQPKGVVVTHRALANRLEYARRVDFTAEDAFLQKTTLSFDVSIAEVFGPLVAGGRVVQARPGGQRDPGYLVSLMASAGITQASFPPGLLEAVLAEPRFAEVKRLRTVITGGETVPAELAPRFHAASPADLLNRYGPTEATISMTSWRCRRGAVESVLPIGFPTARAWVVLLDRRWRPVPVGVVGELCIGGPGLARGYLGRPAATAEVFVPDPRSPAAGGRLYRSGDLARWRTDGALDFVGRRDRQVKVRGFRVELGDIEAALRAVPGVAEAAVVDVADGGTRRLAGYWVATPGDDLDDAALRRALGTRLPEYMVPQALAQLGSLPRSATGKIDRKQLPAPVWGTDRGAGRPPATALEQRLAAVFADLLGRDSVAADDDFFELGGHSLLATRLAARLRDELGVELALRAIFEHPTVAGLARRLDEPGHRDQGEGTEPAPDPPLGGAAPASFAQRRLWFVETLRPGTSTFNIPLAIHLRGRLDAAALARALTAVAGRHEALRTVLPLDDGEPVQVVRPVRPVRPPVLDLGALGAEAMAEGRRLTVAEARRTFDLAAGPLFRCLLLRRSGTDHTLVATFHHLVFDGWSGAVFARELGAAYGAALAGTEPPWTPLPWQYPDFARWQRRRLTGGVVERQLEYWRQRLEAAPRSLDLPTDRPRPTVQDLAGRTLPVSFPEPLAQGLEALARDSGATLFMALALGTAMLLARWSGARDVILGSPVAGRTDRRLEGLIGFFVNALPLRFELAGATGFRAALSRARDRLLEDFDHQELPFERLVEELHPERDLSRDPIFQVMVSLHNQPAEPLRLDGLETEVEPIASDSARLDLSLVLRRRDAGLAGSLEYRTALFDATTLERLLVQLGRLLTAAVAEPERRFDELGLLAPAERHQLLVEWSTSADLGRLPAGATAHELVRRRASVAPRRLALEQGEERWSYGELVRGADLLGARLAQHGVRRGDVVAVLVERSPVEVALLLAILDRGAAFLPLDPAWPDARVEFVLEDASPRLLVTGRALGVTEAVTPGVARVDLEDLWRNGDLDGGSTSPTPRATDPAELAYVIYTSGSTGRPKGVMVTHGGFSNLLSWHTARFPVGAGDRATRLAGPAFDASVWELWPTLVGGGCVCTPVSEEVRRSPRELQRWLLEERITSCFVATPMAEALLTLPWPVQAPLERIHTAGDRLLRRPPPGLTFELCNHYGPTENTVEASWQPVPPVVGPEDGDETSAPGIGRALDGVFLAVVDRRGAAVPVGVGGELLLGGAGLARGYLRRPRLTAERFVPDGLSGGRGGRLYRTGDRVRWRAGGWLDFLGRDDAQVQVRGFRVELGEVEGVLGAHPEVREAAVVAVVGATGTRLVAFAVPASPPGPSGALVAEIETYLAAQLPSYMVPSALMLSEALPWTANGKLDRK
ncbi:MAG: amino acid adenylation domain-containing protein, partial [Acidobacteria bacterium]|nr:amino acid adenylation domain-containing protein [Acidobacteriota bacterium]